MTFKTKILFIVGIVGIIIGIVLTGHSTFSIALLSVIVYLGNQYFENTSLWLLTLFIVSFFIIVLIICVKIILLYK